MLRTMASTTLSLVATGLAKLADLVIRGSMVVTHAAANVAASINVEDDDCGSGGGTCRVPVGITKASNISRGTEGTRCGARLPSACVGTGRIITRAVR